MKDTNVVEVHACVQSSFSLRYSPIGVFVHFPVGWLENGQPHVLHVSALGKTARALQEHVIESEGLLLTGFMDTTLGHYRLKAHSVHRLPLPAPTKVIGGKHYLEKGYAHYTLHGHAYQDSVAQREGGFLSVIDVGRQGKPNLIQVQSRIAAKKGNALCANGVLRPHGNDTLVTPPLLPDHFSVGKLLLGHALDS